MTKNNKSNNQEELFARDCKLMNLKYEYDGYTGTEKWAVITELTEEELWDKYPDIISRYTPFVKNRSILCPAVYGTGKSDY